MSKYNLFTGVGTALITPFCSDGTLDKEAFVGMIRRQIGAGVSALVVGATTGEAPTLSDEERTELIKLTKGESGKVPVIAGAGSNDTSHAVSMARAAELAGANGLLTVTPYYNKTTPAGLVEYFRSVCGATSLPVIAYTVPSRTGMGISEDIWSELFAIPNLIGVKDATGSMTHTGKLISRFGREISVWSGNDDHTLPTLSLGGDGVISVVSNILPERMVDMCRNFIEGNITKAAQTAAEIQPVCDILFSEVNPIPVKSAAAMLGLCGEHFRPPLCPPSPSIRRQLYSVLSAFPELELSAKI